VLSLSPTLSEIKILMEEGKSIMIGGYHKSLSQILAISAPVIARFLEEYCIFGIQAKWR
jgi:hypothetical protein